MSSHRDSPSAFAGNTILGALTAVAYRCYREISDDAQFAVQQAQESLDRFNGHDRSQWELYDRSARTVYDKSRGSTSIVTIAWKRLPRPPTEWRFSRTSSQGEREDTAIRVYATEQEVGYIDIPDYSTAGRNPTEALGEDIKRFTHHLDDRLSTEISDDGLLNYNPLRGDETRGKPRLIN